MNNGQENFNGRFIYGNQLDWSLQTSMIKWSTHAPAYSPYSVNQLERDLRCRDKLAFSSIRFSSVSTGQVSARFIRASRIPSIVRHFVGHSLFRVQCSG